MPGQWPDTGAAWPGLLSVRTQSTIYIYTTMRTSDLTKYRFHVNIICLWFLYTLIRQGKLPCVGTRRLIPRVTRPLVAACPISCTTWWWDVLSTDWEFTYTISSPVHSLPSRSAAPPATMCPIDTWEQVTHCIIFRDSKNTWQYSRKGNINIQVCIA